MLTNRLYYHLKPYLPWRFRMALRRAVARRQRRMNSQIWPINEASGQPPQGWPGWPDGKEFAFVITHDVESPEGLAKCRQLMQLEQELGFRSSFNFVPEGNYAVSRELREELTDNGFEVGVHDLHHDGRLYWTHEHFRQSAKTINYYLKQWGAAGFRGGFMLRNLDWLHALDIQYDTSTFDTDPFEPQPEGVNTIFPFWVGRSTSGAPGPPSSAGYVELPYTLPQDSTLFLLFRESSPEVWRGKLDWIAARGGMVLLATHPDYAAFNGVRCREREYPVEFYKRFLDYVRVNYAGKYWQTLPEEVAVWVSGHVNGSVYTTRAAHQSENYEIDSKPRLSSVRANGSSITETVVFERPVMASAKTIPRVPDSSPESIGVDAGSPRDRNNFHGRHAAVLLFSEYPADPRPRRAAEALTRQGMSVDVFCLQANSEEPNREIIDGVNVFRFALKRRRGGKASYIYQYGAFVLAAFAFLTQRSFSRRYHLVHVHNMPDVLVFSAVIPKLLGAKIVLDLHDPMPELMMTIFNLSPQRRAVRLLKFLERRSTAFAHLVLTVNEASKRIYSSRSCAPQKVHIVMNAPDEQIFGFQPVTSLKSGHKRSEKPFVVMYHGSVSQRNGLDLAVEALDLARRAIPKITLIICGDNNSFLEQVLISVRERDLQDAVSYLGRRNQHQIAEVIDTCDVGIIPNRRNIFTEMNTPTRIFEYLARAKAVIAPRSHGIQDYFGEKDIFYFELGNAADLAQKIEYAFFHPDEVKEVVARGQQVYLAHRWALESGSFIQAITRLSNLPVPCALHRLPPPGCSIRNNSQ